MTDSTKQELEEIVGKAMLFAAKQGSYIPDDVYERVEALSQLIEREVKKEVESVRVMVTVGKGSVGLVPLTEGTVVKAFDTERKGGLTVFTLGVSKLSGEENNE